MIFILAALAYIFIGSIIGGRHHALTTRECKYREGFTNSYGRTETCFSPNWCGHVMTSVWVYTLLWPVSLPATAGFLIGSADKGSRIERRRAREIAEAKHQHELARLKRLEDEELDRQIASARKSA